MIYKASPIAIGLFGFIVLLVLGISWYFARKTKSSKGYFAAGGTIHWGVNGIAFAGDYLSAASFLGICGLIATVGYDGFLYSIGYLAGWIVALFVVAEPMKRLGKYTFTDALDSKFNSKGIQLMAAISTLVVSLCYLIPQMVGAGALIEPLLGINRIWGIVGVGIIVTIIVATAGMKSTTYVQFLKGGLLIVFSLILTVFVLVKGLEKDPSEAYHKFVKIEVALDNDDITLLNTAEYSITGRQNVKGLTFVKLKKNGVNTWWRLNMSGASPFLEETLTITESPDKNKLYNGEPKENRKFYPVGHMNSIIFKGRDVDKTGPLNVVSFFATILNSEIVRFTKTTFKDGKNNIELWYQDITSGKKVMRPGLKFKVDKGSTPWSKLDFISLMLALFFGTAALPHILIRYYTVPSPKDARKSTIVAIIAIGFFYILTLFMGLGAMTGGVLDVGDSNMAAPLLAKSFGIIIFSIISAIAFATVLGTVSGLIVAASGAVAHDLTHKFFKVDLSDKNKVIVGKIAAVAVGGVAILCGILFVGMNVSFLVGWAFAVAASANLPAILMLLFWKKTTAKGIAASIGVGMISALAIILLSPTMFKRYGIDINTVIQLTGPGIKLAFFKFLKLISKLDNPGILSIPLSFITLITVSLLTQKKDLKKA